MRKFLCSLVHLLICASAVSVLAKGQKAVPASYAAVSCEIVAHPFPDYPPEARAAHLKGDGEYLVYFDPKTGRSQKVAVVKSAGSSILDRAALNSLQRWKAKPGTIDKVLVPVTFAFFARQDDRTMGQINRDILYAPYPRFPEAYKFDFASAQGVFKLQIDEETGHVKSVQVLEGMGEDRLDIFASRTLRYWRFRPNTAREFVVRVGF